MLYDQKCVWLWMVKINFTNALYCIKKYFFFADLWMYAYINSDHHTITLLILDLLIIILFWSYCYTNYFLFLLPWYRSIKWIQQWAIHIFVYDWLYYVMGLLCCHLLVEIDFPTTTLVFIDRSFFYIIIENRISDRHLIIPIDYFFLANSQHYLEGI